MSARNLSDGETTYRQMTRSDAPLEPNAKWELLYAALGSGDTTLVGHAERDGTTLYKIVSASSEERIADELGHEFSALVDSEGVVHTFRMTKQTTNR